MALVYSILWCLMSVLNVALNSFLLYALWNRNKFQAVSYWFIIGLSLSDVGFGTFAFINGILEIRFAADC